MTQAHIDVVGIGNAIVDIIGRCDDDFLVSHGAVKGHMRLVDDAAAAKLYAAMGPAVEISGGSVANSMVGLASLGGNAAFIGKVADDEFGRIFAHDLRASGVVFRASPVPAKSPTSRSLILVTPDGERTMNTFLGASVEFEDADVDPGLVGASKIAFLEGYLFDRPAAKAAFHRVVQLAKAAGRRVALSLSDAFCVERHRAEFIGLMRLGIDILIANESEVVTLYETSLDSAARHAARDVPLVVITRSAAGSLVLTEGRMITIAADPVERVVDVTGAGDLYAAGFLYGVAKGCDLATAGRLGSLAAAEVIAHLGARPEANLAALARARGLLGQEPATTGV